MNPSNRCPAIFKRTNTTSPFLYISLPTLRHNKTRPSFARGMIMTGGVLEKVDLLTMKAWCDVAPFAIYDSRNAQDSLRGVLHRDWL